MYVVDSSVWIALFLDDDSQHAKAVDIIESLGDAWIKMPYGVVLEVTTVLSRKESKALADKFVEFVRDNPHIDVVISLPGAEMGVFLEENGRLSFVDALLKHIALRENCTLVSFDKKLQASLQKAARAT